MTRGINPCLWAWSAPDGTNAFAAWPGEEMKAGEDGWYSIKVPVWVNSIIVNANEGSVQTEDISIDPAELWVTVAADGSYDFSYKNPDQAEIPNVTIHVSLLQTGTVPVCGHGRHRTALTHLQRGPERH